MSEDEWRNADSPRTLLLASGASRSQRKCILLCCACLRRMWEHLEEPGARSAIEAAEAYADGLVDEETMAEALGRATTAHRLSTYRADHPPSGRSRGSDYLCEAAAHAGIAVNYTAQICMKSRRIEPAFALAAAANAARYLRADRIDPTGTGRDTPNTDEPRRAKAEEERVQCELIRDVFGNPFRPMSFEPSWRTSRVVALAMNIYEERGFDRMPILADALQEAGCGSEDVLGHCRGPGPHVRGCWVVDLCLNRS